MNFDLDLNAFLQDAMKIAPWVVIPTGCLILLYVFLVAPAVKDRREFTLRLLEAETETKRKTHEIEQAAKTADHARRMEELTAQQAVATGLAKTSENSTESMKIAQRMQEGTQSMMTLGNAMLERLLTGLQSLRLPITEESDTPTPPHPRRK